MANSYLFRNFTSAGNRKTFTFSTWIKFSDATSISTLFATGADSENRLIFIRHDSGSGSTLKVDGKTSTNQTIEVRTNRAFRDTSAWYHIVLRVDTTQSTAADRVRIYVNGVQETSFAQSTYPSQNYDTEVNKTANHMVGRYSYSASNYLNGYMSHAAFVDGASLAPTEFGETDSTSGIWKFKPPSGITWGTNGFHLKFENSSNLGLDSSSNTANWTAQGDLKQSLDTPSNSQCTLNPNDVMRQSGGILNPIYSNGNLTMSTDADTNTSAFGSLSPETGKWYWEFKVDVANTTGHRLGIFFSNDKVHGGSYYYGTDGFVIHQNGQIYYNGSSTTYMASYTAGDIISVALDITNGNIYMSKNGGASDNTWADGNGNNNQAFPGTSINGKLSASFPAAGTPIQPYFDVYGTNNKQSINFGDGFFGTTAITSAGSNGNGSLFEYDVPSGYYALNTKNINTYG